MTALIPHYQKAAERAGSDVGAAQRIAILTQRQEQMRLELDSGNWRQSRWCESFTPMFARHARLSRCFVDVGAESGYYTALARHCMPPGATIIAIEPDPVHASLLQRYFASDSNVRVVNAAAASCAGSIRLTLPPGCSATAADVPGDSFNAEAVVLDELLADVDVDLIKIDVEGAEADVLAGLRGVLTRGQARLYVETHPWLEHITPDGRERMLRLAAQTGYRLFRIDDATHRPTDRIGGRLYWQPPHDDEGMRSIES